VDKIQGYKYQRTYEFTFLAFDKAQADQMMRDLEFDLLKWLDARNADRGLKDLVVENPMG